MKKRRKNVIPGFGLSMGITLTFLSVIVLIPMASIVINASNLDFKDFIEVVTAKRVLAGYGVSFMSAFIAADRKSVV